MTAQELLQVEGLMLATRLPSGAADSPWSSRGKLPLSSDTLAIPSYQPSDKQVSGKVKLDKYIITLEYN